MRKKIAFISTDWNDNEYRNKFNKYGGISYYRLVKPLELLREKYDVRFFGKDIQRYSKGKATDEFYDDFVKRYDLIIVKQVDNPGAAQALVHWCNHHKVPLVQDFDDNILAIREDQPAYKNGYGAGGQRRAYAAAMMSLADALIVSTQPLKDYLSIFLKEQFGEDKDIYVFPNYNDTNDWLYKQPEKDSTKLVIGWSGSITHDSDLKLIMPVLGNILEKHDHVHTEFLGGVSVGQIGYLLDGWTEKAKNKFKVLIGTPAWDQYPHKMMSQAWDIGIAPLVDDEFNWSKSHIKWMEYTMMNIPVIASKVYPYFMPVNGVATIEHEKTGLLASTEKEWEECLESLIKDESKRKYIADNAKKHIEDSLQWSQHAKEYLEIVDTILEKSLAK